MCRRPLPTANNASKWKGQGWVLDAMCQLILQLRQIFCAFHGEHANCSYLSVENEDFYVCVDPLHEN